jgi:hypothetical protein
VSALEHAGELVALETERLWRLDVFDPSVKDQTPNGVRCKVLISQITEACNWGPYRGQGHVQWCTMTWFHIWSRVASLDPRWLAHFSQSTYRVKCWANYQPFNEHKNSERPSALDDQRVWVDLRKDIAVEPQRGDMVIVGNGVRREGDHATVCMGFDEQAGSFDTISGNGGGVGPHGDKREGVSRRTYTIGSNGYRPMWLVRPAFGDLLAERQI